MADTREQIERELESALIDGGVSDALDVAHEYVDRILALPRAAMIDPAQIRREALEEAAREIEPRNDPSDWTEYARTRADAARAIRSLIDTTPTSGGEK
jgi:hypothetical protein